MSQLKVLIYGNHPNLALYAWRFQFAKSVDLYHVSDSKSSEFTIETNSYGADSFQLKKHFDGFSELKLGLEADSDKFDLVILSASSLQEISGITTQLNSVIMNNTKIFVESSGFVQMEPFVRMSISSSQVKVFSLMSDYDIRAVAPNRYAQFNVAGNGKQTIFIGETGSLKSQSAASNSYPKPIASLLTTFHSLFLKLFPEDAIDTCNFSPLDFLTQQWKLAIPRICFDPLLVLFEEFVPNRLHQQILAKPLISGLVTEIITLTRTMGARLPSGYDTESELLQKWVAEYGANNYPSLLYHFEHKTASLDVDLLLLQPILLADDFTIKTPYLEFLYSMMCQFTKLNNDDSKLFTRSDKVSKLKDELSQLSSLRGTIQDKERDFAYKLSESKECYRNEINARDSQISILGDQLQQEQSLSSSLRRELAAMQLELAALRQIQNRPGSEPKTPVDATSQPAEQLYTDTGTPVLRDFEDMAVYAIPYDDSPVEETGNGNGVNPVTNDKAVAAETITTAAATTTAATAAAAVTSTAVGAPSVPLTADEHALRERELKLRRRELDLQERELRLQKKQSQTMLNQKYGHGQSKNGIPPNENPSQYSNQQQGRKLHGQSYMGKPPQGIPGQFMPPHLQQQQMPQPHRQHSNAGLPGMPGVGGYSGSIVGINGTGQRPLNGVGLPQTMLDGAVPVGGGNAHGPKTFQKTSRKNRRSNMPMLRNPSNTMLNDYNMSQGPPGHQASQQRFNSLSGNLPPLSTNYHNGSMPRLNGNPNPMRTGSQGQLSNLPTQPQQQYQSVPNGMRQVSTSTMIDEGPSTVSVIQRPPTTFQQPQQDQQQYGSSSNSNPNSITNSNSYSNPNSNSNSHSTSPPPLESDISSSKPTLSPPELQDKPLAEPNNENNKSNEMKKSKFSFFHSKKK